MRNAVSNPAIRIVVLYGIVAAVWILISDQILTRFSISPQLTPWLQTLKGWAFVLISALWIYYLLRRQFLQLAQAAEEHQESERILAALIANLPGMAYRCRWNDSRSMQFVSEGCQQLTGYAPQDLLNDQRVSFGELVDRSDWHLMQEAIETALQEHCPYQVSYRLVHASGETRWVWEQGRGIWDPQGELLGLEGVISDISERRRAQFEAQRRASQQEALSEIVIATSRAVDMPRLLQSVLDLCQKAVGAQAGLIQVADVVHGRGLSSEQILSLSKRLQASALGLQAPERVTSWMEEDVVDDQSLGGLLLALGYPASLIVPISVEGKPIGRLCLFSSTPRAWEGEDVTLVQVTGRQVGAAAERLGLLDTIQEQALLLQRILDSVRGGIFTLDAEQRLLVVNPMAREQLSILSGVEQGERLDALGGRPFEEFLTPRRDGLPHEVVVNGEQRRLFEVYPNPIKVGAEPAGWTVLLREVTEVRQVLRQVQEQERRASVGQLAAGIAHDFNNIIAAIILYCEILLGMPDLPEKAHQRLMTIMEQGQRAATLTRQILDFSRRGIMEPHPMDLVPLMKEMLKLMQRTLPENIDIDFHYGTEEYVVNTDPSRMQQVFMNLAFNARDAMPSGGELLFELSRFHLEQQAKAPLLNMPAGDWVKIRVVDTGIGIADQDLEHIFEPFFSTKAPGEGTGLGLAQVFGIVRQHGGFIGVESVEGEGTAFTIYLPALPASAISGIIHEVTEVLEGQSELILVVEDDQAMRNALVEMLDAMNYRVLSAADGHQALELFDQNPGIDLVLSDLIMPGLGGVALHERLRERLPTVKMIVMTGYPLAENGKDLLEQGIVAWVQKPLDTEVFAKTLRKVLMHSP